MCLHADILVDGVIYMIKVRVDDIRTTIRSTALALDRRH